MKVTANRIGRGRHRKLLGSKGCLAVAAFAFATAGWVFPAAAQNTTPLPQGQPAQTAPVPTSGSRTVSPSTAEVLRLWDAGTDAGVIKTYIDNSPAMAPLGAEEVVALHEHGVPSDLIAEMIRRGGQSRAQLTQAAPAQAPAQSTPAPATLPPAVSSAAPATTYADPTQPAAPTYTYVYPYPAYPVYPSYSYFGVGVYSPYYWPRYGYYGPRWYGGPYYYHGHPGWHGGGYGHRGH